MAKKIETGADVLDWATAIVEAKGEKFTALSKGEQYVIAQYIVESARSPKASVEEARDEKPAAASVEEATETPAEHEGSGLPVWNRPENENPKPPPSAAVMTRGYAYHRAGFDAQQVFDKFLAWSKDHPKELSVMDFSTGRKSSDAAFAYWLHAIITGVPGGI